jgi:hypothetical protein
MPSSLLKMQKENVVLSFPVQQIQKATPSSMMPLSQVPSPFSGYGGLKGGFLCRKDNRHGCARFLLARLGIRDRVVGRSKVVVVVRGETIYRMCLVRQNASDEYRTLLFEEVKAESRRQFASALGSSNLIPSASLEAVIILSLVLSLEQLPSR